jgi:hypothetical protein
MRRRKPLVLVLLRRKQLSSKNARPRKRKRKKRSGWKRKTSASPGKHKRQIRQLQQQT